MKRTNIAPSQVLAAALALGVGLLAPTASACGGFFCSRAAPVFQSAERIIFAQDGREITQIIEVAYEGPSEKFSWVLPVPGIPEPDVSSKEVFSLLDGATAPRYQLQRDFSCSPPLLEFASAGDPNADGDGGGGAVVTVLDAGSVGPFDYETISVTVDNVEVEPADVAVAWLEDNGYDVSDETGEVLGPYLANGLNLIAFRLQKGQSTGAIRPIVLKYEAAASAIPIIPTSVAANDDMPILVWVLGKDRAVPTNYRGLELNELLIDWFNPSASYGAVVTAAANEAGGQGFVTELAGEASEYADVVRPTEDDISNIFNSGSEFDNRIQLIAGRLGSWDGFMEAASKHIELREGVTLEEFVACTDCYFHGENYDTDYLESIGFEDVAVIANGISEDDPIYDTDLEALEKSLRETVIQPLLDAGDLLEKHNTITRLFTTMSADEMTKDPVFEFNPDAEDVSNIHTAVQVMDDPDECSDEKWTITLEDGTKVYGEGEVWPHSLGDTDLSPNARIVQFSTSGAPALIDDMVEANMTEHGSSSAGDPTNTEAPSGSDTGSDTGTESDSGTGSDSDSGTGSDSDGGTGSDSGTGSDGVKSAGSDSDLDSSSSSASEGDDGGCAHSPSGSQAPFSWLAGLGLGAAFLARRRFRLSVVDRKE